MLRCLPRLLLGSARVEGRYYQHPHDWYLGARSVLFGSSSLSALLTKIYSRYQRQQIWAGWPLCILGLVLASFADSVNGLLATQGLMYGLGFLTLTYPIISMLNEWWVARKGMAFDLISASSGVTGAFMPSIIDLLLRTYGHKTTLRACAVALTILTAPLVPLFKGRLPASEHPNLVRVDLTFLKRPLLWVYGSAIVIQGLGFFIPVVFLPSYATSLGISSAQAAFLLAAMSVAQVLGQFALGYVSDKKLPVGLLSALCCVGAGTASLTLWGLGTSMGLLVAFSLVYGFFGFGFGTLRVAMGREVDNDPSTIFALYAIFCLLAGHRQHSCWTLECGVVGGPDRTARLWHGKILWDNHSGRGVIAAGSATHYVVVRLFGAATLSVDWSTVGQYW